MRWPRPRLTVRRMMVLVLVLGVGLHLGHTAWRVGRPGNSHVHTGIIGITSDSGPGWMMFTQRQPFWAAYWRALAGRSWKDWPLEGPVCRKSRGSDGLLLETCELVHPEYQRDLGPKSFWAFHTEEQKDLYNQLARKKGQDVSLEKDGDVVHELP